MKVKSYNTLNKLENKINKLNNIRDRKLKNGEFKYSRKQRFIASLMSVYYTYKWERWYD